MALTFTHKDDGTDATTAFQSNSVAFQDDLLYLVATCAAGAANDITAVTGGGITWTRVRDSNASSESVGLFVGFSTSGASTGALTFTGTGTISRVNWSIEEVAGSAATSGGTDGIVQSVAEARTTSQTTSSVTLAAFGDPVNNAAYNWVYVHVTGETVNPEGTYTTLAQSAGTGISHMAAFFVGQDTTVTSSWTTSSTVLAIAAEIAAATASVPARTLRVISDPQRW